MCCPAALPGSRAVLVFPVRGRVLFKGCTFVPFDIFGSGRRPTCLYGWARASVWLGRVPRARLRLLASPWRTRCVRLPMAYPPLVLNLIGLHRARSTIVFSPLFIYLLVEVGPSLPSRAIQALPHIPVLCWPTHGLGTYRFMLLVGWRGPVGRRWGSARGKFVAWASSVCARQAPIGSRFGPAAGSSLNF
ncbi:unnamed protein product [Dovyalis caffra]|uniref:Uncharacterized protein n=1 Tax=Dovyalis caffra TaxID=77055 RepID=A0AAV1SLR8_9ROSI|nr:unnamed protein product [Dovyalis caffra]